MANQNMLRDISVKNDSLENWVMVNGEVFGALYAVMLNNEAFHAELDFDAERKEMHIVITKTDRQHSPGEDCNSPGC